MRLRRSVQLPEAAALRGRPSLRRQAWSRGPQPLLSNGCAIREGVRHQWPGTARSTVSAGAACSAAIRWLPAVGLRGVVGA